MNDGVESIVVKSKMMNVWDSLPIYCDIGKTVECKILTFNKTISDISYSVQITPARFEDKRMQPFWIYPSMAEQNIEHALRKIYLREHETEGIIDFDLDELTEELSKSGRRIGEQELLCSLNILSRTHYDIDIEGFRWSGNIISSLSEKFFPDQPKQYRIEMSILQPKPFLDY